MVQINTYDELKKLFGKYYDMPSEDAALQEKEVEYRCPYILRCPTSYKCYVTASPTFLPRSQIINIKCKLMGGRKIPVYTTNSELVKK